MYRMRDRVDTYIKNELVYILKITMPIHHDIGNEQIISYYFVWRLFIIPKSILSLLFITRD